jgi:hypothetical protein
MLPKEAVTTDADLIRFDPNRRLPFVFIAGPYTKPSPQENVANAIAMGTDLVSSGLCIPSIPLLVHTWDEHHPHTYQFWIEYTKHLLSKCDYLLRLPGESKGADDEVILAGELNIPVFFSRDDLINYLEAQDHDL